IARWLQANEAPPRAHDGGWFLMFTRRVITTVFVSCAFWTGATATRAQDKFPSRTIRIIVPFAPGGGVDTLARLLAERMQAKMSVNVIVENRAGANGTIGG